ncbi:MAG TPA: CoA transferase [Frankiaceae bacterium]|nr:CoA transferase [Frankiaceae bacterium]
MSSGILEGVRVIDLSIGLAGPVAAQLLAEAGADVIKVEPPDGDPTRSLAAFATWNRSKRSVALDLRTAEASESLEVLLASADVVVHGLRPSVAKRHRLDDNSLKQRFPRLIVCTVAGYPPNHAASEREGYDLLVQARSGLMGEQLGWRDGPIALRFPLASWAAAYLAAAGIVTRLMVRSRTGKGGPVSTSLFQGMLTTVSLVWNRAQSPTPALMKTKYDSPQQVALYQCSDGAWLQIMNPGEKIDIGALELTRAVLRELGESLSAVDAEQVRRAMRHRPCNEWLVALRAADVAVEPVLALGEMLRMPEVVVNGYTVEVDDPIWGRTTQPMAPFRTQPPSRVQRPAPRLDEHAAELAAGSSSAVPVTPPTRITTDGNGDLPMPGLKVLDLGAFLAGPLSPMLLGDLGADVIKVEPIAGDRMRFMANYFEACSRGKRSIAVDLTRQEGQEILARLVRWADVVHHNQRRKAAQKLGIDEAGLRALNPNVVFGYVSAYGERGERADWPGFDSIFQALGGWELANAGLENPPLFSRFGCLDVQCALASLVGTLLALYHRERTGTAGSVSCSLLAAAAFSQSETLLRNNGETIAWPELDHDQTGFSPGYRIYQAADGWIAVAAFGPGQRAALRDVAGAASDVELSASFARLSAQPLLDQLRGRGLPAELVREGGLDEFFDDADNRAAGLVAQYPHLAYGSIEQPGAYWHFGDLTLDLTSAAPVTGQHTVGILSELGYCSGEIEGLIEAGVVAAAGVPAAAGT